MAFETWKRFGTVITIENFDKEQEAAWDAWDWSWRSDYIEYFDRTKGEGEDEQMIEMGFEPFEAFPEPVQSEYLYK